MIRIPFEEVVKRIAEKSGLAEAEIMARIETKCTQLSGLISKDGAAHIVANELGVQLIVNGGRLKVKDAFPGMRSVEIAGKVTQKFDAREFSRQDGTSGKLAAFTLGDETGTIRVVAWGEKADEIAAISENSIILLQQAQVRENNRGFKELHIGSQTSIVHNPPGVAVGDVAQPQQRQAAVRKMIKDLSEQDQSAEIVGTIVQVFDPKYYEVCPTCNKRSKPDESGKVVCPEHGAVQAAWSMVGNAYVDDGSGNIRVVFFRNQLERLTNKTTEQLLAYREIPERFEEIKTELLGNIVKVTGRASKNQFFDRLEFVAQFVQQANADEELARLQART
jgi:replication factor A1